MHANTGGDKSLSGDMRNSLDAFFIHPTGQVTTMNSHFFAFVLTLDIVDSQA